MSKASAQNNEGRVRRQPGRAMWGAAAAAFLVRIAIVVATKSYLFTPPAVISDPLKQHWQFGFEIGRVARSIAEGRGFGSPFHGWTGPTAWYAPIYPYLLAGVFKVFGVYSPASGLAILTLNSFFAALTCIPIFFVAQRAAGKNVALWSAWLWALTPIFFPFATKWAWETSLSALLMMVGTWASIRLADSNGWREWFAAGVLWGVIALANTAMLSLMPFLLGWAWWQSREKTRTRGIVLAFAVMFLTVLPWTVRNHAVFGRWIFVRDNFWAEMRFGNAEQSRGIWLGWMNPTINDIELRHYAEVGELPYIAEKKDAVQHFIRQHPGFFADLCLRRFFFFWSDLPTIWSEDLSGHDVLRDQWRTICFSALAWVGMLLLVRRRAAFGLLLAPGLLVYPLVYYLASADPRYRHPIEPVMLVLAVYAVAATRQPQESQAG